MVIQKLKIREDCRRDGLAATFLLDGEAISHISNAFSGSIINIGYPSICDEEYNACKEILEYNKDNTNSEFAVVGHARKTHLISMNNLLESYPNASANIWMPTSDYFIKRTINIDPNKIIYETCNLVNYWNKINGKKHFDVALTDITASEDGIERRLNEWGRALFDVNVRNIILCDTRGIATPESLNTLLGKIDLPKERLEFHPHNDNNYAKENVTIALNHGIYRIGTAIYNSSERQNMLDPRDLVSNGLNYNHEAFLAFEQDFKNKIGDPNEILKKVYGDNVITTGTQYRLRNRDPNLKMVFGVTSDTFILSKMLGLSIEEVTSPYLQHLKNKLLYERKKLALNQSELKQILHLKK